jgi:hypothetical protein
MSNPNPISRRDALKQFALICGAAGALAPMLPAQAMEMPHLSADDPQAKALGYADDSSKVDAKKYSTFAAGQKCSTCMQSKGNPGDAYLSCNIFAGKSVNANGWCQVWVKKA